MTNNRVSRSAISAATLSAAVLLSTAAYADLIISSGATQNVSCSAGVCTATAKKAVLNVNDLTTMLAAGDATVKSGSIAQNIDVKAAISWTSASRLTLDSLHSIEFQQPLTVAGTGALTITTNDGGSAGDFSFSPSGHVEFWDNKSRLVINGNRYKLVSTVKSLSRAVRANPSGFFALSKSYDATADGTFGRSPVATTLLGVVEGLGNSISNLHVTVRGDSAKVGLFAEMDSGSIRDLVMSQAIATARGMNSVAGMLIGLTNGGTISGVNVSGAVTAPNGIAGGICGTAESPILYSHADGTVQGGADAGGLCGFLWYGPVNHSSAAVSVSGVSEVGGLIGFIFGPDVSQGIFYSYAAGSVTGTNFVGGLVGYSGGNVQYSFATGAVVGGSGDNEVDVGGLVGVLDGASITNCYARGSVHGGAGARIGGLAGESGDRPIWLSYSTGNVSGANGSLVGGFVGEAVLGYTLDDYWDIDSSGTNQASADGPLPNVTGLTTSQFKSGLPSGFDSHDWAEKGNINNGYPYLLANPPPAGDAAKRKRHR